MRKYRSTPTEYAGVRYASKAEAARAAYLDDMSKAGVVRFWLAQPTLRLGVPENVYRPDFLVVYTNGIIEFEDVKGVETAKFKRDKKLWAAYGPASLRVVKRKGKTAWESVLIPGAE